MGGCDPERLRSGEEAQVELVKDTGETTGTVELPPLALEVYKQEQCAKFLATSSLDGVPNVALIVSQTPAEPGRVVFGEFMMVKTQANLAANPHVASIAITEKLEMAGFKGDVTGWTTTGKYIDMINSIPFFRYNAYAGIHNVATTEIRKLLPLPPKVSMATVGQEFVAMRSRGRIGIMSVKVLAYQDSDGYPNVVPTFGIMFRTPSELRFKVSSYNRAVTSLQTPATVAINVLTMDLMTYQVKGTLVRFEKRVGLETGVVRIEEVYSSMPPLCGERLL
jgi:hypothetical protein